MSFNLLTGPIPGQSLTREPGSRPYETPPQFNTVDEAMEYLIPRVMTPDTALKMADLMEKGLPATAITESFLLQGFADGKWSVDLATLVAIPLYEAVKKAVELVDGKVVTGLEEEFKGAEDSILMSKVKQGLKKDIGKDYNALYDETPVGETSGLNLPDDMKNDVQQTEGIM